MINELRRDYFMDKWTVFSQENKIKKVCVFCKEERGVFTLNSEEKNNKKWDVKVIEDPNPSVHPSKFNLSGLGSLFTKTLAHGYSEIVIETPEHKPFHELSTNQIKKCLGVYLRRIKELKTREKVECVIIEKNYSEHSNTKIFTFPKVTEKLNEEIKGFNNYKKKKDCCVFCDVIQNEKKKRIIHNGKDFLVICPFAASLPYETWILSKKHIKNFWGLEEKSLYELSEILSRVTKKFSSLNLEYNFVFHESPSAREFQDFHFHIEVYPSKKMRSREINFNLVSPEKATAELRF